MNNLYKAKKMISEKKNNQITLIAYATVSNLFAMFHNPKMRGEKFTWNDFPKIASDMVGTQVFCNVVVKGKKQQLEIEERGKKIGFEIAEKLVKEMSD